jgi:hypothetical protein
MRRVPAATRRTLRTAAARLASLASLALVLGCGWLATMELFFRRPGFEWRFVVEAAIVIEGALTIALLEDLVAARLRWPLTAGAGLTGVLGWWVVAEDLSRPGLPARPHFEGYLLLAGLILIAYGALTMLAMLTRPTER